MRRAAVQVWAMLVFAPGTVSAQDLPFLRLAQQQAPAASAGQGDSLAGPGLLPPAPAPTPSPGQSAPDTAAPLRVAPPAAPGDRAAQALGGAVLTVDQEEMYRQSRWGLRAQAELAAQSRQIAADNDRAFADLVADEDALTAARATLSPDEFRDRAARFDERVTAVRAERQAALDALTATAERDRALFFQAAAPVLGRVMRARGAQVVLDQRTVLIADERIDATAATIAALDAELGDGRGIIAAAARAQEREQAAGPEALPDTPPLPEGGEGGTLRRNDNDAAAPDDGLAEPGGAPAVPSGPSPVPQGTR